MSDEAATATTESQDATRLTPELQERFLKTGQLFETLAADPKYRKKVLGIIKEANPAVVIPELDVDAAVEARLKERDKSSTETTEALRKELDELKRERQREKFAESAGLSDEELVEVETMAKEAGINKAETALEHYRMKNQLGTPRPTRQAKEGEAYLEKVRKVKPTDGVRLKALAIEEGTRIIREMRGRRAG